MAFVFRWPLDQLERLSFEELLRWRERAIKRWNAAHAGKED
ncbi:GpE family phage tail protein [Erythrobacter sp. W302b]